MKDGWEGVSGRGMGGISLPPQHPPHHPFHPDFSIRKLTPEKFIFRLFEGPVSWEENPASLEGDLLP
jgi:hypothetical protein